jgi:hypothetical protein
MGINVATPRVMVRFRDVAGSNAVSAHNNILRDKGKVSWGLWLKDFENKKDIIDHLNKFGNSLKQIYIADTSSKDETSYLLSVCIKSDCR